MALKIDAGSFRDPSGYVYSDGKRVFRSITDVYRPNWEALEESLFLDALQQKGWLVAFHESDIAIHGAWKTLEVERLPFISYPYEWSFGQLKDAALLTLDIQLEALAKGFSLKDASAYNIQFLRGKPILIDIMSLERLTKGAPWVAYPQFCTHFLAPLALMAKAHIGCGRFSALWMDGIPLDVACKFLPFRSKLHPRLAWHIVLHAYMQRRYADTRHTATQAKRVSVSPSVQRGVVESLRAAVSSLSLPSIKTTWGSYYEDTNYSATAQAAKQQLVHQIVERLAPDVCLDLGANDGTYSRIAAQHARLVLSADGDPLAVDKNYRQVKDGHEENILPLVLDLTNPTPGIGWDGQERASFVERTQADLVLALALVHHLAIGNNVPLERVAEFFSRLGSMALVEFIPKEDSQVQRMLSLREDIFANYTEQGFLEAFSRFYTCVDKVKITETNRTLFLFRQNRQDRHEPAYQ